MRLVDTDSGEVRLPGSDTIVGPRYPGGVDTRAGEAGTRRQQLAIWIVSGDNPYLARATVNLVWRNCFGRGLVEPLDDFGSHNPASHPELLETLSEAFIASGYNLAELYRTLANTRAYQLASRSPSGSSPPAELFAQMSVKTLTSEQLFDSLQRVAMRSPSETVAPLADPRRQAFLVKMQTQTRTPIDFELSVPQALAMMNGPELSEIADPSSSRLVAALDAPFLDDAGRVEAAFLTTLAREPSDSEGRMMVEHLQAAAPDKRRQALGDMVWVLLNSAEFMLNH